MQPSQFVMFSMCLWAFAAGAAEPQIAEELRALRAIEGGLLRGNADELRMKHRALVRAKPSDNMLRVQEAWCDMPSDESWNALKGISTVRPEYPWAHYGMGRVYLSWKMRDQASKSFRTALQHRPRFFPALIGLGDVARLEGRHDQAIDHYRTALGVHEDPAARAGLGLSLLEQGKVDEGRAELTKAVEGWPDQPAALSALAELSHQVNDAAAAVNYLAKLLELSPKDARGWRRLADLHFDLGHKEEAAAEYERFLLLGADVEVLRRLAGIYREANQLVDEERIVRQLAELEAESSEHPLRLSELAEARGAWDVAEQQLQAAQERSPPRADWTLRLARVRVQRAVLREALEAYRQAASMEGASASDAAKEGSELAARFRLPAKPPKGGVQKIYSEVSASLDKFYAEQLKAKDGLAGVLKVRVKVSAEGKVSSVEMLEDTVKDPLLAGHVYFSLKDAQYPRQRREPIFEFQLGARQAE